MKATDLLKKDHAAVKKLMTEFGKTTTRARKKRQQLVDRIAEELEVHARIEEEIFYPALRELEEARPLLQEAEREHQEVKTMLAEIKGLPVDDEQLGEKIKELKDAVLHHVKEEEGELFTQAKGLGDQRLTELGRELQERKQELTGGQRRRVA